MSKEKYSFKIKLNLTQEEIELIKNPNFEKDQYVSTKYFSFNDELYNNVCIPLVRKNIVEHREIGYPLKPDLGIKLTEYGEQILKQLSKSN